MTLVIKSTNGIFHPQRKTGTVSDKHITAVNQLMHKLIDKTMHRRGYPS